MNDLIDQIIQSLNVVQELYYPSNHQSPDLLPYPPEFTYLGRRLHSLGSNFSEMKIMDLTVPRFDQAVIYCILGSDPRSTDQPSLTNQELIDRLGINVLVVGPDESQYQILTSNLSYNQNLPRPYVIIYRSFDDLYYPIVSLETRENYIFYRPDNSILQQWLPESVE